MKALIVSLKFHPGHFSHLIANYKLFSEKNFDTYLYVDPLFNKMDEKEHFQKINSPKEFKKFEKIDVAVFWFPSLKNILEMFRLRFFYGAKIFYVYHEPFDSIKNYYSAGFNVKKIFKICLINLVHVPILLLSHRVILPSPSSYKIYKKKYTFLNDQFVHINLLFDDEANLETIPEKKYFSYIGTVAADHAFDRYVDFVVAAVKNSWLPTLDFQIATSSVIPTREMELLKPLLESGRIKINAGKPMKNSEINQHYRESAVVWNAYHRSMQSGVLPKAFMFGSPAIVLRRNASEFLDHLNTGVLIEDNGNLDEIKSAVEELCAKKEHYFHHCRNKFFDKFYYRNKAQDYLSLLKN